MLKKIALLSLSVASAFALHTGELNINDKDLQLKLNLDLGQFNQTTEPNTTFLGFNYLNADGEHGSLENGGNLKTSGYYESSFLMKREINDTGVLFGIGVKANYANIKINNKTEGFISIPLGLELGYKFPLAIPVILGTKVYYAPESLTFADANDYLEYSIDLSVEVIERGSLVGGFRNIDTNTQAQKINYNKSGYFGFRFAF
jgi:hypothetical protein